MWILFRDLPVWILLIIKPCSRRILKSGVSKYLIDFFSGKKLLEKKNILFHWYSNKPFLTTIWHKHCNRSNKEVLIFKITLENVKTILWTWNTSVESRHFIEGRRKKPVHTRGRFELLIFEIYQSFLAAIAALYLPS